MLEASDFYTWTTNYSTCPIFVLSVFGYVIVIYLVRGFFLEGFVLMAILNSLYATPSVFQGQYYHGCRLQYYHGCRLQYHHGCRLQYYHGCRLQYYHGCRLQYYHGCRLQYYHGCRLQYYHGCRLVICIIFVTQL